MLRCYVKFTLPTISGLCCAIIADTTFELMTRMSRAVQCCFAFRVNYFYLTDNYYFIVCGRPKYTIIHALPI